MSAGVREGFSEAHTWRPRVGGACSYTYLDHSSRPVVAPARIVRVRPDWVLDVDVKAGARTVRHYAVRMALSELRPNTWSLRDALVCPATRDVATLATCHQAFRSPSSRAV